MPWWRERTVRTGCWEDEEEREEVGVRRGCMAMNAIKGYVVACSFSDAAKGMSKAAR